MMIQKILVTGAAGFIGFHLTKRLLESDVSVVGLDNLNNYYDVGLKKDRLAMLKRYRQFEFAPIDLVNKNEIDALFGNHDFQTVINLAAQAGVRYSITNPYAYLDSNLTGFLNILEACRQTKISHLIYASSSSVYGANRKLPFSVHDNVDHPLALYAASKKANELMAHAYSSLYKLPTTGLRFFTAYGPWGRPDMALFLFTKAILEGKPIDVYNFGKMKRDFTYIDDIVEGLVRLIPKVPAPNQHWSGLEPDPATSPAPYRLFNIGNGRPVELMHFIDVIEKTLGKKTVRNLLPIQEGDVEENCADTRDLEQEINFKPGTSIDHGIERFVVWYKEYYKIK
jgi:UDP-glucuronate 4-epimerase